MPYPVLFGYGIYRSILKLIVVRIVLVLGLYGLRCRLRLALFTKLFAAYINIAGRNDVCIVCNAFEASVDGICNAGKEIYKSACRFLVCSFKVENNGALSQLKLR